MVEKPIEHKHLILRLEVENPPVDPEFAKQWIRGLVDKIGMNLVNTNEGHNPISAYVDIPGNRGLTVASIIETSHITMHVWDECVPALVQIDVYTCSTLNPNDVYDHAEEFGILTSSGLFLDREYNIHQIMF